MDTLRTHTGLPVGYSDHTAGSTVSLAAVARGARVIEKHFTLDRSLPGPDHAASLEPAELTSMISAIREVSLALGSAERHRPPANAAMPPSHANRWWPRVPCVAAVFDARRSR